jgi:hypothetical protein
LWSEWITHWRAQVNATRISEEVLMQKSNNFRHGVTFVGFKRPFYEIKR